MVGGAFDYHPPNQEVAVRTVDEDHPLVAAFKGKGPFIHRDEPYCFNGAYEKLDFRPLLSMDVEGLKDPAGRVGDMVRYVAWIRAHGDGRVFYCSPSHFPESYESATLLQFLLDGANMPPATCPATTRHRHASEPPPFYKCGNACSFNIPCSTFCGSRSGWGGHLIAVDGSAKCFVVAG